MIAYVCMIAVDASSRANGCPELGWRRWQQKEGWVDIGAPVDDDVPLHPQDVGARDLPNGVDVGKLDYELMGPYEPVEMGKGDVLIYDNYMPHRSGKNEAAEWRRALRRVLSPTRSTAATSVRSTTSARPPTAARMVARMSVRTGTWGT